MNTQATQPTTKSLWRREHPASYDPAIERALLSSGFVDESWHNDICAKFERPLTDFVSLCVWVEHADPKEREAGPETKRFTLVPFKPDEWAQDNPIFETDNVQELLTEVFRRVLEAGNPWVIFCSVSGGVTGLRTSYAKEGGKIERFATRTQAEARASEYRQMMAKNATAIFTYAAEYKPEGGAA